MCTVRKRTEQQASGATRAGGIECKVGGMDAARSPKTYEDLNEVKSNRLKGSAKRDIELCPNK